MSRTVLARSVVLGAVFFAGCFAAAPPPAVGTELGGCHPSAYGRLSEETCARDADCVLCGEPDGCGEARSRRGLWIDNSPCPAADPDACAGATAACCRGRCVLSLGPPPL